MCGEAFLLGACGGATRGAGCLWLSRSLEGADGSSAPGSTLPGTGRHGTAYALRFVWTGLPGGYRRRARHRNGGSADGHAPDHSTVVDRMENRQIQRTPRGPDRTRLTSSSEFSSCGRLDTPLCPITTTRVSRFFFIADSDGTPIQLQEFGGARSRLAELFGPPADS